MKKILLVLFAVLLMALGVSCQPQKSEAAELDHEAVVLAQLLYSLHTGDAIDLRTMCWCVFNRVDHPAFPRTVEDVLRQENQFPGYSPNNPLDMQMYRIAQQELAKWREHGRTVRTDFVYPNRINGALVLMDRRWMSGLTDLWRYGM